jgi:hypothetical protein
VLIAIESAVTVVTLILVHTLSPSTNLKSLGIVAFSFNPVAILLTCQHCNFDALVGLWVLLAVVCLISESGDSTYWLGACLFLGLGILTKTVPLILVPLLAEGFRRANWFMRFLGAVFLFGPASLGLSIMFALCPQEVIHRVIFYHSVGGVFGISGFLELLGAPGWIPSVLFATLLFAWFWFGWRMELAPAKIVLCAALILAAIPAVGPGYSTQYIFWFMPLLIVTFPLFGSRWKWALITFGLVAVMTYLFEYGFLAEYGCTLIFLFDPNARVVVPDVHVSGVPLHILRLAQLENGNATVWVNLPLFIAYLVMLTIGVRAFRREG